MTQALAQVRLLSDTWGYRKCAQVLRNQGWKGLNDKRVERIWRLNGWQRPPPKSRKPKVTGSLENACHIRRATSGNQVWAIDFVEDSTMDGRKLKLLTVLDEFTRQVLSIRVERSMGARQVANELETLIRQRGAPEFIRSDNGSEFTAKLLAQVLDEVDVEVALIAPGSPWQNGKNERFNGILSQECLSRELFGSLLEARVLIREFMNKYNEVRPHGSLGMQTPARFAQLAKQEGQWFGPPSLTD